jgi:lysine biosynthesis protein LysW
MASAYCPDCDKRIVVDPTPSVGKKLTCPHCGAFLEVVANGPLKLDWAREESDGYWEDDDW